MAKPNQPTRSFAVRFAPAILQKIGWAAASLGVDKGEYVRRVVGDAVKDAKPPVTPETLQIQVDPAKAQAYLDLAAAMGVSFTQLLERAFDPAVRKHFGTAPKMRNGKLHWKLPDESADDATT